MIVVIEAGGVVDMPWLDNVPAVVMAWYPGMVGGRALGKLLLGKENFSGKLPVTWPLDASQFPIFDEMPSGTTTMDYFLGYRRFDLMKLTPRYSFGYGLSYARFQYANLHVPCSTVTKNGVDRGQGRRRQHEPARRRGGRDAVRAVPDGPRRNAEPFRQGAERAFTASVSTARGKRPTAATATRRPRARAPSASRFPSASGSQVLRHRRDARTAGTFRRASTRSSSRPAPASRTRRCRRRPSFVPTAAASAAPLSDTFNVN